MTKKEDIFLLIRSLHTIKRLCTDGSHIYPGHGSIGTASDVDLAIKALDIVIADNLLDMNEDKCIEKWNNMSSNPMFPNEQRLSIEWDPFLKVSIVQSDEFSFAKLIDEHEH